MSDDDIRNRYRDLLGFVPENIEKKVQPGGSFRKAGLYRGYRTISGRDDP